MQRFDQFKSSFFNAYRGLRYVIWHEKNFQTELAVAVLVIMAMVYYRVTRPEMIVLFMVIMLVLIMEILNTIMERVVDILKPRIHPYARVIKDLMAASVLLSATLAVIIGLIIFIPYIFS
jgi:diacylglycerol kinase